MTRVTKSYDSSIHSAWQDMEDGLYGSYHFNFISPISRQRLEDLAMSTIKANAVQQVQKLFDQYVNFICMENEMFVLRHQGRIVYK